MKKIIYFMLLARACFAWLETEIETVLKREGFTYHVGIEVVSLNDRKSLYSKNEEKYFVPASSLKLFTVAAALDLLGCDFTFETKIFSDSLPCQGVLNGNLYLRASGDPSLNVDDLDDLALQLKNYGIERIEGNLILDLSIFDDVSMGPGWMWDEKPAFWNAPLSAMTVEHNCITINVKPQSSSFCPKHPSIRVEYRPEGNFSVERFQNNTFIVTGYETQKIRMPVEDPVVFAMNLFQDALERTGVELKGFVETATMPPGCKVMATHHSSPLSELIKPILKNSDNLYANLLFKTLGAVYEKTPGTWQKGSNAVYAFIEKRLGIFREDLIILDGSGESRYNLLSPHQLVQLLLFLDHAPYSQVLQKALSHGGIDGTLKTRISNIKGKTGTMTGVSSLAGFTTLKDGKKIAFAILSNGFVKNTSDIKKNLEDQICTVLTEYQN